MTVRRWPQRKGCDESEAPMRRFAVLSRSMVALATALVAFASPVSADPGDPAPGWAPSGVRSWIKGAYGGQRRGARRRHHRHPPHEAPRVPCGRARRDSLRQDRRAAGVDDDSQCRCRHQLPNSRVVANVGVRGGEPGRVRRHVHRRAQVRSQRTRHVLGGLGSQAPQGRFTAPAGSGGRRCARRGTLHRGGCQDLQARRQGGPGGLVQR